MVNLNKEPSLFERIFRDVTNEKKPLKIDNGLSKNTGDGEETMLVSNVLIKSGGEIALVSAFKSYKKVKGVREDAGKF